MGVNGKLVSEGRVKCSKDDLFQVFKFPNLISNISPETVQSVHLLAGHWGTVGSIIIWNYTIDGKKAIGKEIIEAVDDQKKSITFKVIEGDLMAFYNAFRITVAVDSNVEDNLVTWSFEYEKKSEAVPDPKALMDYAMALTKQIERHCLLVPN